MSNSYEEYVAFLGEMTKVSRLLLPYVDLPLVSINTASRSSFRGDVPAEEIYRTYADILGLALDLGLIPLTEYVLFNRGVLRRATGDWEQTARRVAWIRVDAIRKLGVLRAHLKKIVRTGDEYLGIIGAGDGVLAKSASFSMNARRSIDDLMGELGAWMPGAFLMDGDGGHDFDRVFEEMNDEDNENKSESQHSEAPCSSDVSAKAPSEEQDSSEAVITNPHRPSFLAEDHAERNLEKTKGLNKIIDIADLYREYRQMTSPSEEEIDPANRPTEAYGDMDQEWRQKEEKAWLNLKPQILSLLQDIRSLADVDHILSHLSDSDSPATHRQDALRMLSALLEAVKNKIKLLRELQDTYRAAQDILSDALITAEHEAKMGSGQD